MKNQSENNGTDDEVAMNSLLSEMKGQLPDPNITVSTESVGYLSYNSYKCRQKVHDRGERYKSAFKWK